MFRHKTIDLLRTFSSEEIGRFKKFLHSPYFNKSKKVISLFNAVKQNYPKFDNQKFTKYYLFKKLGISNESTFRVLCSDLLNLIYKFLSIEHFTKKKFTSDNFLFKELSGRKQYALLKSLMNRTEKNIEAEIDFDYFYDRYLFESYKYNYLKETQKILNKFSALKQSKQRSRSDVFLALMFITETICDYINEVISSGKYNIDIKDDFTVLLLNSLKLKDFSEVISKDEKYGYIADLYFALYNAFKSFNIKDYTTYKRMVKRYTNRLSTDENSFHYLKLISFCILKINKKKTKYLIDELFSLYETYLRGEYYKNKKIDYIQLNQFRAILQHAIRLREYNWAESFIDRYHKKVQEKYQDYIYYYSYAQLYLELGEFNKALECVEKIEKEKMKSDSFIFKYDTYNLKLRILYENNIQGALDILRNYKEFLKNDTFFTEQRKTPYKNFVKYLGYLIKCKEDIGKYEPEILRDKILNCDRAASKDWLLKKIDELEKIGERKRRIRDWQAV